MMAYLKYRTSYDGLTSEVNYFYFFFFYDNKIISDLISELICIQIERFAKILLQQKKPDLAIFLEVLPDSISRFSEYELKLYPSKDKIFENVNIYLKSINNKYDSGEQIPRAPSKYSTVIPKEGLNMNIKLDNVNDLSKINYQIF